MANVVKVTRLRWEPNSRRGGVNVEYDNGLQRAWELREGEPVPEVGQLHDVTDLVDMSRAVSTPPRRF